MNNLDSVLTSTLDELAHATSNIDVIVIGSGTAGVTSAIELAKGGLSVVILEAGQYLLPLHVGSSPFRSREDLTPKIHNLARSRTSWIEREKFDPDEQPVLNNDAWSVVGGRTIFWGGCTPRFADWDFNDWPVDAGVFRPYYEKAEDLMHVSGREGSSRPPFFRGEVQDKLMKKMRDADVPAAHGLVAVDTQETLNGHMSRGFDSSVARLLRSGLIRKEPKRGHIVLVPNAICEQLDTNVDEVTGISVIDADTEKRYRLKARHFVLAGGAVQSTRLAMASGLQSLHPCVGRYMGDHLFVQGLFKLKEPLGGPIYVFVEPTEERPFHVQIQGAFKETWYSPYHTTVFLDGDPDGLYMLVYVFGVGEVNENNELTLLDEQADGPKGMGKYCVIADHTEEDVETLQRMEDYLAPLAESMGADLVRGQINPLGAALHEIGGLRMGKTPEEGVTDDRGQFWSLANLSVADSAAWPSQGSANSYLTITAWSLRHAEAVLERLMAE